MKIAKRKSTGEYINDFQTLATEEVLIANAVKSGLEADDVEVLDVEKEEYDQIVEAATADARAVAEIEARDKEDAKAVVLASVKKTLGLTDEQFALFLESLK